jgi:hypothetical protein
MQQAEGEESEGPGLQLFPAELKVRGSTAPPESDATRSPNSA